MIDLRRELVKNAEENLRTTREMFNTGLANQANVLLAENEFSRAKIDLATRENEYEALWQHLIATLGTPELALSRLEGQLEPNGPPLDWDESGSGPRHPRSHHDTARTY
jgi:outer membrane protein TolC